MIVAILTILTVVIAAGLSYTPWKTLFVSASAGIATLFVALFWAEIIPGESPTPFYFSLLVAMLAGILHSRASRRHLRDT